MGKVVRRGRAHQSYKENASERTVRQRGRLARLRSGVDWCQRCGFMLVVETHHRDGNPFNDEESNYEYLCMGCHDLAHIGEDVWGAPLRVAA